MITRRGTAIAILGLIALGLWIWLLPSLGPGSRREPPPRRTAARETISEAPTLRGEPLPTPVATLPPVPPTEEEAAADPLPWRLEVRTFDGHGTLLRGVPNVGGGTTFTVALRFASEDGRTAVRGAPDEAGVARLTVRGSGRLFVLPASPWQPHVSALLAPPATGVRQLDVELTAGLEITGTVLDHRGEPLPGPRIQARPAAPMPWGEGGPAWMWGDRTKADGSFRIQGLVEGTYRLDVQLWPRVLGPASSEDPGRLPEPPVVEAGTDSVVIQLLPPTAYTLKFMDAAGGEPVRVNVHVYARVGDEETWLTATFGGQECEVDAPSSPGGIVHLEAEGYVPRDLSRRVFLDHAEDRVIEVPLRADPGGMVPVVLKLRDDAGRAVEQVSLARQMTVGRDRERGSWMGTTLVCPDGRLELRYGVGPLDLRLDPADEGWQRFLLPMTLAFDLERGTPVEEEVVFERGGAVLVRIPTGANFGFAVLGTDGGNIPNRTGLRFHEDGSREVAPIPPGDWQLVYWIDGEKVPSPDTIQVRRGEVTEVPWNPELLDR